MRNSQIRTMLLFISAFAMSCANQTQPTGGPKDEDPPVLESSDPAQGSINVTTDKVELTFDEFIKTDNPKEQLIITPRVDIEFDIKYRKNKAIITFEEELPDSTTFTFNFREALVDITESNAPENLKLAFSSGEYLDSLSITGNVKYHLSDKLADNATVALYEIGDTLDIFTGPPLYFTKTDEEGNYTFDNLKSSLYKIYAFQDINKNLTAESKSESYGFQSGIINLDSSFSEVSLPLLNLDVRPLELQSARQSGTTYNIKYNKSVKSYQLIPNSEGDLISTFTDEEQNNIRIYNTFNIADSLEVFVSATDSLNVTASDTVYVKFEPTQRKPADYNQQFNLDKIILEERIVKGSILFNKPIVQTNLDSVYIYIDSTHVYHLDSSFLSWDKSRTILEYKYLLDKELFEQKDDQPSEDITSKPNLSQESEHVNVDSTVNTEVKPDLKPHIRFAYATFITAENDSSSNIDTDLLFTQNNQLGLVSLKIETDQESFIIQLLDGQDKVVQEEINKKMFDFKYIQPGTYRIRIIIDENANGQWDPGNILSDIEPEPILFYQSSAAQQELTIRANFEIVPDPIVF